MIFNHWIIISPTCRIQFIKHVFPKLTRPRSPMKLSGDIFRRLGFSLRYSRSSSDGSQNGHMLTWLSLQPIDLHILLHSICTWKLLRIMSIFRNWRVPVYDCIRHRREQWKVTKQFEDVYTDNPYLGNFIKPSVIYVVSTLEAICLTKRQVHGKKMIILQCMGMNVLPGTIYNVNVTVFQNLPGHLDQWVSLQVEKSIL